MVILTLSKRAEAQLLRCRSSEQPGAQRSTSPFLVIHTEPAKRPPETPINVDMPSKPQNTVHAAHPPRHPPRPPRPRTARVPLNTWTAFEAAHRAAENKLAQYLERGRKGSVGLDRDTLTELDRPQVMFLPANNADARLRYARITAEHLDRVGGMLSPDQAAFFVTFINRDHAVREDEAASFDIRRLHSWTRQILGRCSYVGMAEGAFYGNVDVVGAGYKRAVSWHTHAIVWGISELELAGIISAANARNRSLIDGIAPAHYRPLNRAEVGGQALYMSKGQISEYRVWPRKRSIIDPRDGVISIVGTGRFSQAKRNLRPGDMARMCRVFAGRCLDQLAFGGGAGKEILKAIRHEAGADLRRHEGREAALRASRGHRRPPGGGPRPR